MKSRLNGGMVVCMKQLRKELAIVMALACVFFGLAGCKEKVPEIAVTRVTITGSGITNNALTMLSDDKITLAASVSPSDATQKDVTWSSSNKDVAVITEKGELTAVKEGAAEISATAGGVKGTLSVSIVKGVPLTSLAFEKTAVEVNVGASTKLVLNCLPGDATDQNVVYSIAPDNGAKADKVTVNAMGLVEVLTGAQGGSTYTVTAVSQKYPEIKATCKINILEVALSSLGVRRNNEAIDLSTGESNRMEIPMDTPDNACFLVPSFSPENTSQREVTYTSSDPSVLKITQLDNLAVYSPGPSAAVGKTVSISVKGQNGKSLVVYAKITAAKNYAADELTDAYLNSLTIDYRTEWNIEKNTSVNNYDTAGNLPLSKAIWRGTKSTSTFGGVNPWDGVWGIIFDTWDNPYSDNELPNQYMYNKVSLGNKANYTEFRVRSHTTPTTSERGKFRIRVLVPDGKGGYSDPVVLKKVKGIGTADANGWIEISNCTVADYEAARDYFYFDTSAYKGKTVVFLFEVDDMHDKGLAAGKKDSGLCDRICFLGAEVMEEMIDRTKKE